MSGAHVRSARAAIAAVLDSLRKSPIREQPPPFDTARFLARARGLADGALRSRVLAVVEQGYTVVENSVEPGLLDAGVRAFREWKARHQDRLRDFCVYDDRLDRIINIQDTLDVFKDIFAANRALAVQDALFQEPTCLYSSLFFEVGSQQDAHRDIPLFWTRPATCYFGTWLALEDTDADNGPLRVIPGSHKLPLLHRGAIARAKYQNPAEIQDMDLDLWQAYQSQLGARCRDEGLTPVDVCVKKGDTIIWHPLLAHGGAPVRDTRRTRLSWVVHTTPHDVPVFHNDVFFNPSKRVRKRAGWPYENRGGRLIKRGSMSIGHGHADFDFGQLR